MHKTIIPATTSFNIDCGTKREHAAETGGVSTGLIPPLSIGGAGPKSSVSSVSGAGGNAAAAFEPRGLKGESAIGEGVGPSKAGPGAGRGLPEDLH